MNEFRTSCRCHVCGEENEKFMRRQTPLKKQEDVILVHGLLRCKQCKNENDKSASLIYNRDYNGSKNILAIGNKIMNGEQRPEKLSRSHKPLPLEVDKIFILFDE